MTPVLPRLHILGPEGPRPALNGTGGINRAAGALIPEDTIAARLLGQAVAVSHPPHELGGELLDGLAAEFRDPLDLFE